MNFTTWNSCCTILFFRQIATRCRVNFMDNSTDKGESKTDDLQKLDLSGLRDFNFASNWSEAPSAPIRREKEAKSRGGARPERRPDRRPSGLKTMRSAPGDAARGPGAKPRRPRPGEREERPDFSLLRESPFEIQIFPDEPVLATLTRAMRQSLRTYELFEVARLILEKPERFHISFRYKNDSEEKEGTGKNSLYLSVPDGLPFTTEEAAVDHVVRNHLDKFFEVEEFDGEPPKGNFQFIARCTLTGDFLSPPNYHRYQPILLHYYQERFPDMPFERFRGHIETVKDEEAVARWLESMKRQKRYKLAGSTSDAGIGDAAEAEKAAQVFETLEDARAYLLQHNKGAVVRPVKAVRIPGKALDEITAPEIKPYLTAYLDHQRRFPLDTANMMRGRLRRQHFFIYKKGARGISFVCAVKRKHREPGQTFSESIGALIEFLEKNPEILASQLPEKFLGITRKPDGSPTDEAVPSADDEKLKRLNLDLRWLVSEGYVTEYSDGRLVVHAETAAPRVKGQKEPAADDSMEAEERAEAGDSSAEASESRAETEEREETGELLPEADESPAEAKLDEEG